jgi:hypothetical protein
VELTSAEDSYSIQASDAEEDEPAQAEVEEPAAMEPFEPEAVEIAYSAGPEVVLEPKTLAVAPVAPSLVEPFEPVAPKIEFTAKPVREVSASMGEARLKKIDSEIV